MTPASRQSLIRIAIAGLAAGALLAGAADLRAQTAPKQTRQSRQEETRRKLLEQVGLEKSTTSKPPPPTPSPEPPTSEVAASATADAAAPASTGAPPARSAPMKPGFTGRVHQDLLGTCRSCHIAGGPAAASRLVLGAGVAKDHQAVRGLVDPAAPRRSLLLTKATGTQHGGGPTIPADGDIYRRVLAWIAAGATLTATAGDPTVVGAPAAVVAATPRRRRSSGVVSPPTPMVLGVPPSAISAAPAEGPPTAEAPPASPNPAAPALPAATPERSPAGNATALALHTELTRACRPCHQAGGPAGMSRYKLTGVAADDLTASRVFLDADKSAASPLATKAAGDLHGGGPVWAKGGPPHQVLLAWLAAGAPDLTTAAPAVAGAESPPRTVAAAPASVAPARPVPASPNAPPTTTPAPGPPAAHPHGGGIALGHEFTLNGRFDLNLERRSFATNPWSDGAKTALQSHHHFLFLGRQSADDPLVFTVELTSLAFYEAALRLGPRRGPSGLHLRAGKLLVPFGTEPLFHQSYGGHVGFDQRVLPAIWATEGAAATGHHVVGGLTLTADLYGVRGHALRRADAVLNLQSDLSPVDDVRPAYGMRLGAAVGPLTGYYSLYFNPLGHDRRLFMQALDVSLWRWRDVPVLDRLVLGAGLLRADVSGGGAGADYFHFASYWLARVYAMPWLWVQYRQGLRTVDNKRNLTYDARRAGPDDGSTHNFTVSTRYRGLSVFLSYFINVEKADEVDDDLARLGVVYEF